MDKEFNWYSDSTPMTHLLNGVIKNKNMGEKLYTVDSSTKLAPQSHVLL
jgi:hypothetical protein